MEKRKGFLLVSVLFVFLLLLIIVPVMIKWVQEDMKASVKDQQSSIAFNLAEAAVDRGYWKVKGSTGTFAAIVAGNDIPGYNFDAVYTDITGGSYRISISSGPGEDQITVIGEGRNTLNNETRSIKSIYNNTSVPGAIVSRGVLTSSGTSVVHWGPIMSMADIYVSGAALVNGYPRKLSRQIVHPFNDPDLTVTTDNEEWTSNADVPELPIFDFETLRASAAATSTLNCQDGKSYTTTVSSYTPSPATCSASGTQNCSCTGSWWSGYTFDCNSKCSGTCSGSTPTPKKCTYTSQNCTCSASGSFSCGGVCSGSCTPSYKFNTVMQCCHSATLGGPITCDYGDISDNYTGFISSMNNQTNGYNQTVRRDKDYVWYWDGNSTWTGAEGVKGTIIVRGDLAIYGEDYYCSGCTLPVPPNAWREYQKYDTEAKYEYPGDCGKRCNDATYTLGSSNSNYRCTSTYDPSWDSPLNTIYCKNGETWNIPKAVYDEYGGSGADLGVYGFLYVGGDLTREGASDIYGSMWVEGKVTGSGNAMVFYNSKLKIATLNVVLVQDSWKEITPSTLLW